MALQSKSDGTENVRSVGISGGVFRWISSAFQSLGLDMGVWSVFGVLWHASLSGFT